MAVVSRLSAIVLLLCTVAHAARILGVFPHPAYSHQVMFRSLMAELSRRGHELVIFTTDPLNEPTLQNYSEIDLHYFYNFTISHVDFYSKKQLGVWSFLRDVYSFNENITDETLSHPAMQRLISPDSTEKFDLIVVQNLLYDALYALSIRLNAPLITITAFPMLSWQHYNLGSPLLLSYSPDIMSGLTDNMDLWQRFVNVYYCLRQLYEYVYIVLPKQEKISRKHFQDSVPPAHQLSSRISLHLVNGHPFYDFPRANLPLVVQTGQCHLMRQRKSLPQDLQDILDNATEGYIYFSLGSNLKSNSLPLDKRDMLLRTFARLPYKVLWKFESDFTEDKSDNVIMRKWLPQQEILAHANLRLFIYQGGLQSTEEAIESGVPVIGFPFFLDQFLNVKKLQFHGVGKMLDMADIDEDEFRDAILEVIVNSSYKENMMKLRNLLRDLPYDPLNNTIWWVEHVIRHKGAPHLHNRSRDMPWYQIQLLDIIAIALGAVILVIGIVVTIIRRCVFYRMLLLKVRIKQD